MSNSGSHGEAAVPGPGLPERFTYPFCYTPHPLIVRAAEALIARIDGDPALRELFAEGKMMGVLMVQDPSDGSVDYLYGFSGLAGGRSVVEGFVPPIFDTTAVDIDSVSHEESVRLQNWLFEQYVVCNARGERRSIREVFSRRGLAPPGGTGDCAAPKMLQYAYNHGLRPLAMGEFWYGASPASEVRRQGSFYPSCTGKCGPLLGFMLEGLDVEPNPLDNDHLWALEEPVVRFEDASIVVVEKPSGMLAVPGRTSRRCLQDWLSERCGCPVFSCHRLDMDTSGLMVFAKSPETQAALHRQFEGREVQKQYLARLCPCGGDADEGSGTAARGLKPGDRGKISLPLMLDYYDRPRQMVDFDKGKPAVTEYEVLRELPGGILEVRFIPYTGRTHQLRVHAAHSLGLNRPILGDRLYGGQTPASGRLMLHASLLSFRHPVTGSRMRFESGM
ncbi:MAG: RluA family pseudouridine synthase [Bacteroidales bacterium]|nr:RluA family pseudouridine synthase [Bacteroidales bacterium]